MLALSINEAPSSSWAARVIGLIVPFRAAAGVTVTPARAEWMSTIVANANSIMSSAGLVSPVTVENEPKAVRSVICPPAVPARKDVQLSPSLSWVTILLWPSARRTWVYLRPVSGKPPL